MKKTLLFLCSSVLISSSMYAQLLERSPLPASIKSEVLKRPAAEGEMNIGYCSTNLDNANGVGGATGELRSEERRVGKEC